MNISSEKSSRIIPGSVLIILLCALIYGQVLTFDFINLDDDAYITLNPVMYDGLSWSGMQWALYTFGNPYYMPLTKISFLIDAELYGVEPWGFHLTNLIFHIINSVLVLYFVWKLTGRSILSSLVGVTFAVHPQHIESFVWIAERKEVLSAFFGLFSLIFYIKFQHGKQRDVIPDRNYSLYLLSCLTFLFSLLSKPLWITLPFVLLLLDYWPLQRLKRKTVITLVVEKIPYLLLGILFLLIMVYSVASEVDQITNSAQLLPLTQRLSNIPVIYTEYLLKTFYPFNLPNYYPYPLEPLSWKTISGSWVLILLITGFVVIRRDLPYLMLGWLWFLGTLFPTSGLIAPGESVFIANRWTYLPHIGLFIAVYWQLIRIYEHSPRLRKYLITSIFLISAGLSISSFNQAKYWQNSETYWQQAINTTVDNHTAYYMLGTHYLNKHRNDDAIFQLGKAYQLKPDDAYYGLMLGTAYSRNGDIETAWHYYDELIDTAPPNIRLLTQMGLVALKGNRTRTALRFFQAAIKSNVERVHHARYKQLAYLYAGQTFITLGSIDAASRNFEIFLNLIPEQRADVCHYGETELKEINEMIDTTESIALLRELCP